jgi:hypothetical protein
VEVDVADPVAPADHGLVVERPGEAEARAEVVAVGVHQRPVVDVAVARRNHGAARGVEVREDVVRLPLRRAVLVAQAEVERQLAVEPEVVLQVAEVQVLADLVDQDVAERVTAAQAEHEIGQVVLDVRAGAADGAREAPSVLVAAVERVHVLHLGLDVLPLEARLQGVPPQPPRVVELRREDGRVLSLGLVAWRPRSE